VNQIESRTNDVFFIAWEEFLMCALNGMSDVFVTEFEGICLV